MATLPIYLDYNATTPVDPAVVEAMLPYYHQHFGNASSAHAFGHAAHVAVDRARSQVAALIGAEPGEIIFTQGGSESDNLALKGVAFSVLDQHPHIIASVVEHPAILMTLSYLRQRFGVDFTLVGVDEHGAVLASEVLRAIRKETVLISVMAANNEVGTIQNTAEIGALARERGIGFHVDAAQGVGKFPIDVREMCVDMLTIAGHKLYAPKGIGVLYVRRGVTLDPLIHGGGQERGLRSGTENVPSIVGLGKAAELASAALADHDDHLAVLRDALHAQLAESVPGLALNGHPVRRTPGTLNVSFPDVNGQTVLDLTPEIAASTGSACHTGSVEPSATLLAMGLSRQRAAGAVRLSLGRWTTTDDIHCAASAIAAGYRRAAEYASAE